MDVFFEQGLSRNGIDESYFDFLGLGKKKREKAADAAEESQLQDLESRFPDRETFFEQQNYIKPLKAERNKVAEDRRKAKSKKSKATLDSRLRAYDSFIKDYEYALSKLKLDEEKEAVLQEQKQREIIVSPAPIITSQNGGIVLPKKQVYVQETSQAALETEVEPLVAKKDGLLPMEDSVAQGQSKTQTGETKKPNYLIYVGVAVAALFGIILTRKKA
jgi:LPXTG-motif cell wall-anchored protein